jgi:hypothetical protein
MNGMCQRFKSASGVIATSCHFPRLSGDAAGTRALCMKTIFQMPPCFWRKADSSHFWLTVPEASVMLP